MAVAEKMLDMCGDLEQAVQLWFADEDLQRTVSADTGSSIAAVSGTTSQHGRLNRSRIGREDEHGVIHIDSDDDAPMTEVDSGDDTAEAANIARKAQEEEDAAMAKRLQEELYSAQVVEDNVRAPIARRTETLIGPDYGEDDPHSLMLEQFRRRQHQARIRNNNPFAQSPWGDNYSGSGSASGAENSRASRLAELFRPPYELISRLSWDEARDTGKEEKKWLLVNLQDMSDFNCQALNRDIWKDNAVKSLVRENFIFLQYEKNDFEAERYITYYFQNDAHHNPNNYPHVSIIDPRTGEQVKVWSGRPFPTALEFHSQLVEFLDRYSLDVYSKNPVSKIKRSERTVDLDRMTEEEMLEMALKNSLEPNGGSANRSTVIDPDALTKSSSDLSNAKGKERATSESSSEPSTPESEEEQQSQQASPWARIPSDRPHTEPSADPKTTTRIQVRNPAGRIIRRFLLDDPVSRIYEWIKADQANLFPGKEGVVFELKAMPQGVDLIEKLNETIKDAGLANGTVMLEFVEEE
ncbi:uncharacterized protein CTHT_0055830 [Thermochaetoides thermophila DSM 1495]|uniref:UBX domain-containing protein n=1 Tax=Chaetomium thermophilum (strain DSM 1495 / CBS 144.50 / IMI 039719) TaxID=759272 RepID=G0SC40_CHATD|nr:hypothetical protein CTHT_0055830 [Thermochaetoides thermophila DSM 1495]EGS18966.1 hypothetical protein CTHT_0055830 [Thermochaetoides thermophila DSM 1495]